MVDGSPEGLADARYQRWRTMGCPEEILAVKLCFALPMVGSAVSDARAANLQNLHSFT